MSGRPLTRLTAVAAPLVRDNINTDVIIPSREMKTVSRRGLADGLFADWRYTSARGREPDPAFVLNDPRYAGAEILLTGANFGCGSSREHAAWALAEYGFRVILAEGFNPIFRNNAVLNGIAPIMLAARDIAALADDIAPDPRSRPVTIDLTDTTVTGPGRAAIAFEMDDEAREMLLEGLDGIDLTLKRLPEITAFPRRRPGRAPMGLSVTDASARLVDHALGVRWARLPASAQQAARTFLHDTICVGVAGRSAANADLIWRAARTWGGEGGACLILGRPGQTTSAPYAAFANAFQIHAQEFDCVHEPAVAHPLATVLAALMAEAQRSGPYSGETFLSAMVAGVDVVATLGVAVTTPLKFFRPATAGVFGSIAALARLRGLDRKTAIDAFGYGLAFASGTMQAHLEGKPTLAVQVANAARSAVEAIDLAAAGLEGPVGSIDGPFGYLPLFEDGFDLGVLDDLGVRQRIEELSWKPFPTGRAAHGAIVALRQMVREERVTAETLASFVYRAPPLIARLIGRRPFAGMQPAYARLCFAYLGAVVLVRGDVGLESFDAETLNDPAVLALAERIVVEADGNPDPAAFTPAAAVAVLADGSRIQIEVTRQFGSPGWPLNRDQHFAKARACLAFGGLPRAYEPLTPIFDNFDQAPDAAEALRPAFG